jgi:hypothetical protein
MRLQEDIIRINNLMGILSEDSDRIRKFVLNKLNNTSKVEYVPDAKILTLKTDKGIIAILTPSVYSENPDVLIVNEKFTTLLAKFINAPYYPIVETIYEYMYNFIKDEEYSKYFEGDFTFSITELT